MNHDYQELHGRQILHSTLRRDYICGVCGSGLKTEMELDEENRRCTWRTVCIADPDHDPSQFIHTNAAARRQSMANLERLEAREVFRHLPPELQEAILANQ